MGSNVQEVVFKGYDNDFEIVISLDGQLVDFTAVTRMTIELSGVVIDSDVDAAAIQWDANGVIVFDLGGLEINNGQHSAIVIAYDPLHPNGQVICHQNSSASLSVLVT